MRFMNLPEEVSQLSVSDDCYSNDPENKKGPKLKSWQDPIGSIRHLHGIDCKSVSISIAIDWTKVTAEHKATVSQTFEGKNTTFEYSPASWQKINEVGTFSLILSSGKVEAVVRHKLTLSAPVAGLTGASTSLEGVPKQVASYPDYLHSLLFSTVGVICIVFMLSSCFHLHQSFYYCSSSFA